jgi:hypothetical protein
MPFAISVAQLEISCLKEKTTDYRSPLQAGTEDRDQEIAPSAEGQN